jgi:hypothetical protein
MPHAEFAAELITLPSGLLAMVCEAIVKLKVRLAAACLIACVPARVGCTGRRRGPTRSRRVQNALPPFRVLRQCSPLEVVRLYAVVLVVLPLLVGVACSSGFRRGPMSDVESARTDSAPPWTTRMRSAVTRKLDVRFAEAAGVRMRFVSPPMRWGRGRASFYLRTQTTLDHDQPHCVGDYVFYTTGNRSKRAHPACAIQVRMLPVAGRWLWLGQAAMPVLAGTPLRTSSRAPAAQLDRGHRAMVSSEISGTGTERGDDFGD